MNDNNNRKTYKKNESSQSFLSNNGRDDLIIGRNAVMEALKADVQIDVIYLLKSAVGGSLTKIITMAKSKKIVIKEVQAQKLDSLCASKNHQGIAAITAVAEYISLDDILNLAKQKNEPPFLIICDEIEDPHNLGAIIRTAEAVGVHGVIIPKRRSATLTQVVYKTSAGAASVVPVCRVSNLSQTIDKLKQNNIWIYSADMDGTIWCELDYTGGVALIIGSEGNGINRIIKEQSDFVISLPMQGQINSLNASVAAGIVMYEINRQRLKLKAK